MKVLVVGGGGREHALIRKIKESKKVDSIACCPGNGGISYDAKCYNVSATDIDGVVNLAKEIKADFVKVGCHKIPTENIKALFNQMNNQQQEAA